MSFLHRNSFLAFMLTLVLTAPSRGTYLKFASLAPEGTSWMKRMHELADELADSTEGRVRIKFYPGGVAGDERDVLRKIRIGQIHAAGFTGNGLGEIVPAMRVLDTPFLFVNLGEYDAVLAAVDDTLRAMFREQGFELAGWASVGMVYLFSKEPIPSADALRKSRPWVWETDPLASALFARLHVSPIPLPLPQVLTNLQTGVINVAYGSPTAAVSLQWFTRVSYMTDLPLTHSTGGVVISSKFLNKLEPVDREMTLRFFQDHLNRLEPVTRNEEVISLEVLSEEGIQPIPVAEEDVVLFRELGREVRRELVGQLYPQWLLDEVITALSEFRTAE